jgi:hypothetical protein
MSNEPERPIEKLLRAAAQKRRDEAGAPLELHPATRRLLQGEVARQLAKPERAARSFPQLLARLWPRFALGVALFAVLVVAARLLVPMPGKDKSEALLAKNEPIPQAAPAKEHLPTPPAATATVPAAPPPVTEANPSAATFTDAARPTPSKSARQYRVEEQRLLKDSSTLQTDRDAAKKLESAAAPRLADREKAAEAKIAASGGTRAPLPAGTVNGSYERQLGLAGKPAPPGGVPAAPASPSPIATTPTQVSEMSVDESAKRTREKADQPAFAYKSPPTVASASSPKYSSAAPDSFAESAAEARKEARSVSVAQRFAQVAPGSKAKNRLADKASPAQPVLTSFQVEQSGSELRIVDGDGSVYSGFVQLADHANRLGSVNGDKPAAALALKAPAAKPAPQSAMAAGSTKQAGQNYYFRVTGTNRTLHKKVVFTGNLVAAANVTLFTQTTNASTYGSAVGGSQPAPAVQSPQPLLNARISGKAVIGDRKEIEINAVPTGP